MYCENKQASPMKFLCDQMLSRVGKWLRAAGYDTDIVTTPISDTEILTLALANHRLLITRDRHFLKMKNATSILIYLKSNHFKNCIQELNQQLEINWLYAPFSRCLNCNSLLEQPNPTDLFDNVPIRIQQQKMKFWYCPTCKQVYWEGTHTSQMISQLTQWQREVNSYFFKGNNER